MRKHPDDEAGESADEFVARLASPRLRHIHDRMQGQGHDDRHVVASAAILRAFKILSARVEAELEVVGLTMPRYEVLGLVDDHPDGHMSPTELSRATLLHPATMTHTINALEKRRLIRRRPKATDKRVLLVEITPLGRKVIRSANQALAGIRFGVADLSEADASEVAVRLSRLQTATGEHAHDAEPPQGSVA